MYILWYPACMYIYVNINIYTYISPCSHGMPICVHKHLKAVSQDLVAYAAGPDMLVPKKSAHLQQLHAALCPSEFGSHW